MQNIVIIEKNELSFFADLISFIKSGKPTKDQLSRKKRELCKALHRKDLPTDIEIYLHASKKDAAIIRPYLQTKPIRTGSGVAVVATMTAPFNCPHGSCIFCPGGVGSYFGNVPKSYTGKEPSTMRGIRNEYDPYRIIFNRLEQYIILGQNPDKVDQIIMGGTFPSYPKTYKDDYIYYSFKAYNDFSQLFYPNGKFDIDKFKNFFELPGDINSNERSKNIKEKILKIKEKKKTTLDEEQRRNETADIRCIGLTIETKPDWGFKEQGLEFLNYGVTRVELGIQTVYNDILKKVNRGHTLTDSKKSISELRDLGFKLNFHMMPGLPTAKGNRISRKDDIESLKKIFSDSNFRPDMLKIYPCMVMPGTPLEKEYLKGIFKPLTTEEAADIIVEGKRFVPEYCRIMRVQRDIPTYATKAGVDRTNLRQYVSELAQKRNVKCRCIRCREIRQGRTIQEPHLVIRKYDASKGKEFFISIEADDKLLGFVRLRFPARSLHPTITKKSALIRELHVYGTSVEIGKNEDEKTQHKGFGKRLMATAEEIAKNNKKDKMVVISGIGVREYYKKLGYSLEEPYMVKIIN